MDTLPNQRTLASAICNEVAMDNPWYLRDFDRPECPSEFYAMATRRPVIAIHDGGIDLEHIALAGRVLPGRSFDRFASAPRTKGGSKAAHHGTLAALLAAGEKYGVAPTAHVLPVRYTGGVLRVWKESLLWASEHADIVLCPWVMDSDESVARELAGFVESNCQMQSLFVCPVGNHRSQVGFPASLPGVLGVGALTSQERPADYSGRGRGLDVLAPSDGGNESLPTIPVFRIYRGKRITDGTANLGGTSAAAALAAGVAANIKAKYPEISPAELLDTIRRTARPLEQYGSGPKWNGASGFGRINAVGAYAYLAESSISRVAQ